MGRRLCTAAAGTRLDRGSHGHDRVSMVGRPHRALPRDRGGVVRLKVDVIVTGGNAAVAAKRASSVVPIVFALVDDPVGMGLIASLARPGGNVTGLSLEQLNLAGKRLE